MSKTSEQWFNEGLEYAKSERWKEALNAIKECLNLNPTYGLAWFKQGFWSEKVYDYKTAVMSYKKALDVNYKESWVYFNLGVNHVRSGEVNAAIDYYLLGINLDPNNADKIAFSGALLKDVGRKEEALNHFERALRLEPNNFKAHYHKGCLMLQLENYQEALKHLQAAYNASTTSSEAIYRLGNAYMGLGQKEKAMETYKLYTRANPGDYMQHFTIGQIHHLLGNKEKALECFKKVRDMIPTSPTVFAPSYVKLVEDTLHSILDVAETVAKTEEMTKNLDKANPAVNKFLEGLKNLNVKKNELENSLLKNVDHKDEAAGAKNMSELEKLKLEMEKKMAELQASINKVEANVAVLDQQVSKIHDQMNQIKEELDSKMDDFEKKLEIELNKKDVNPDDKIKLKGYFRAFMGTFSATHVTAQVIDSGQIVLDKGSTTTTILSSVASFAPFMGNALSGAVETVGEFMKSKEMKTSARKMKGLAADASALSQLIGKTAFELIMDDKKRKAILNAKDADVDEAANGLFKKLSAWCSKMSENIDIYLYTAMYKTTSERLGHKEANDLIGKWIGDEISPYHIQEEFVKAILDPKPKSDSNANPLKDTARPSACCNMF